MTRELESSMLCPPPVYSLLTALTLGTSGCDRQVPLAAEPRAPQAVQQSRDSALAPIADTYIRQGNPNQNQGTELILRLQASGKNRAFLRWDPQGVPGAIGADSLVAARLELTITHNADNWGTTGRTIDLHRLTQAWTETGATWNCADDTNTSNPVADCSGATAWAMDGVDPRPYVATPTATRLVTNGLRGVVTLDVTGDVRGLLSGGGAQYGWILKKTDDGASGQVEFGSRESGSAPKLVLTVVAADTSRPPVPAFGYPDDSMFVVQDPADTQLTAYRRLALVRFADTVPGVAIRAFLAKYGAQVVGGGQFTGAYIIQFPDPGPTWAAFQNRLNEMRSEPGVKRALPIQERDYPPRFHGRYPADGPGHGRSAWFGDTALGTWAYRAVRTPLAWGCETGTYGGYRPRVGVLEWQFDLAHPELQPSSPTVLYPPSAAPARTIPTLTFDTLEFHGTAVSGVIAAPGDNGRGIAGMTWRSSLQLYAMGRVDATRPTSNVVTFVEEVLPRIAQDRLDILTSSIVFGTFASDSTQQEDLVDQLRAFFLTSPNTIVVYPTGNSNIRDITAQQLAQTRGPAGFQAALTRLYLEGFADRILFVAGTEPGNALWGTGQAAGSNYVVGATDIAAPAFEVGIMGSSRAASSLHFETARASGTSFAAPMVAGVGAQLRAMDSALTGMQVKDYIVRGAQVPRLSPATGLPVAPNAVANTPGTYQLDAYGALSLLSRERTDAPICGLPVSAQLHVEPVGIQVGTRPVLPVPNLWSLTSVAQGGRLIAARVLGDTTLEVRILDHRGDSVATLAPNILERHFLERDTADLVAGGVQLPNGFSLPELVLRRGGTPQTIPLFAHVSFPADLSFVFGPLVAVSPAGDAAATAWGYGTPTPPISFRWELVALPSGAVTPVAQESPSGFTNVAGAPASPPAWSHDGRRVVFPIIRGDVDQEFAATATRTQLVSVFGGQRTTPDPVVEGREIWDPRFSSDDNVLYARERELFTAGAPCFHTRRSPAAPHALVAPDSLLPFDCGAVFPPRDIIPNIRLRPGVAIAAADGARVRGSNGPRGSTLPRRGGGFRRTEHRDHRG